METKKWSVRKYLLYYTLTFALFAAATFLVFIIRGKSFVWWEDGRPQYFVYTDYIGKYLRDFFQRAFKGDFRIKMFDFTIGTGDDVRKIFRTHPFALLSVFVPTSGIEVFYNVITLLRMYLSGLSFYVFAKHFGKKDQAVLAGSMVYLFCGYLMHDGIMHPHYLIAFELLPLLLLTGEYALAGQHLLLFSFIVFLGLFSNYYMMYMMTLTLGAYLILRFPSVYREQRVRNFFIAVFRVGIFFLLGAAMACLTLLPTIHMLSASPRIRSEKAFNLLSYGIKYRIARCFLFFIAPSKGAGSDTALNYCVLAYPAVALTFFSRKKGSRTLRIGLLLSFLMLIVPAGSFVMDGFSSTNCRWIFILSFMTGYALTGVWDELVLPDHHDKIVIAVSYILYAVTAVIMFYVFRKEFWYQHNHLYVLAGLMELTATVFFLLFFANRKERKGLRTVGLFAVSLASCLAGGLLLYDRHFSNFGNAFVNRGTVASSVTELPCDKAMAEISSLPSDGSFSRIDCDSVKSDHENTGIFYSYNSTSFYNSLLSPSYSDFMNEQENIGQNAVHRLQGLDGCSADEALLNVKWFVTASADTYAVPYGFVPDETISVPGAYIYKNTRVLPFGYTYTTAVAKEDYEKLNPAEKRQVMLEGAVVDEVPADMTALEVTSGSVGVTTEDVALPEGNEKIYRDGNTYTVREKKASLTVPVHRKAGCETCLRLNGLKSNSSLVYAGIHASDLYKRVAIRNSSAIYATGRTGYTVNLGYSDTDADEVITITFESPVTFTLDSIQMMNASMKNFDKNLEELEKDSLQNVSFDLNSVSGTVSLPQTEMMVFSVPCSDGWTIRVDGEKVESMRVNTGFPGALIPAGDHDVRITYTTPGSKTGNRISAAAWLLWLAGAALIPAVRRKKQANGGK